MVAFRAAPENPRPRNSSHGVIETTALPLTALYVRIVTTPHRAQPLFVTGDLDGFFGLAIDNLIQFLLILGLCSGVLQWPMERMLQSVLPGAALSMLVGNLYYARKAQQLSQQTGRHDVTALPYGINTVSLFAFVFLVMLPVKLAAEANGQSAVEAGLTSYRVGLAACFLSAIIELAGAPVADLIRRHTPRAALLATLSGIAISFIAIDFAVRTFAWPLISLLPLCVILTTYFGGAKLPFRIPGGAWAVLLGTALSWISTLIVGQASPVSAGAVAPAFDTLGLYIPLPLFNDLWIGLTHPLTARFLVPVILPMGLFNVLGSLQNLESAEAAGDRFPTAPCLAVNGLGSAVAAVFGSCFPTTIYIGHPGWKALGARSGYSILSGAFFCLISLFGLSHAISTLVPIEAGMAIVLWIGLVITAQAFQATPSKHAPAIALGLFPAITAWGVLILTQTLGAAVVTSQDPTLAARTLSNASAFAMSGLNLQGMVALSQGFMLTCLLWAAASAHLIDHDYVAAARWLWAGAALAFLGFIHVGTLTAAGATYDIGFGTGAHFAVAYGLCAVFVALLGRYQKTAAKPPIKSN